MKSNNREWKGKESWFGLVVCESRDVANSLFLGPSTQLRV